MHARVLGSCQERSSRAANCVSPQHCRLGHPSQLLCLLVAWHPTGGQQAWSGSAQSVEGARSRPLNPPRQNQDSRCHPSGQDLVLGDPCRESLGDFPHESRLSSTITATMPCMFSVIADPQWREILSGEIRSLLAKKAIRMVRQDEQQAGFSSQKRDENPAYRRLRSVLDSRGLKFLFKLCVCVCVHFGRCGMVRCMMFTWGEFIILCLKVLRINKSNLIKKNDMMWLQVPHRALTATATFRDNQLNFYAPNLSGFFRQVFILVPQLFSHKQK